MGFLRYDSLVGKWVTTIIPVSSYEGEFSVGSRVKIVSCGIRGYDIKDSLGNKVGECGWTFFDKDSVSDDEHISEGR